MSKKATRVKFFKIAIGVDEKSGKFIATIDSLTDGKIARISEKSFRNLQVRMGRALTRKVKEVRTLPLPEPTRIILPDGAIRHRIITAAGGNN